MTTKNVKKAVLSGVKAHLSQRDAWLKKGRLRDIECQIQAHENNITSLPSRAVSRKGKDSRRIVGKASICALELRLADAKRLQKTLANLQGQVNCLAKEREVLLYDR